MNQDHLSDWQIEERIIQSVGRASRGGPSGAEGREDLDPADSHAESCEICRSKQERLAEALRIYRDAAITEAGAEMNARASFSGVMDANGHRPAALHPFSPGPWRLGRWAIAFLVLLAVLIPISVHRERERRASAQIARDNLLLEQVDQEVTYSVPQPLYPLTGLVLASSNADE